MRRVTLYLSTDKTTYDKVSPAQAFLLAYLEKVNSGTNYRDTGQEDWFDLGSGDVNHTSAVAQKDDDLAYDENVIDDYLSGSDEDFSVSSFKISASDLADGGELSGYLSTILEIMENDSSSGYNKSWSDSEKRTNAAKYATNMVKSFTSYSNAKKANDIWCELIIWGIEQTGYVESSSSWEGYSLQNAINFEAYILKALGVTKVEYITDDMYEKYDVDGTTVYGYKIDDKIKESFEFVDTEVEVSFTQEADNSGENANTYKVGPYKLSDYIYYENFCYISSSTLQLLDSNGGTITLDENSYHFEASITSGSYLDSNGYPMPDGEFYVVFEYGEDIQGIANLSFKLEYMNGAGSFTTYSTQQWVCSYPSCEVSIKDGYTNTYHVHCSLCGEVIYSDDVASADEDFAGHTHKYCEICESYDVEWDCWDPDADYETNEANLTHTHYYCTECEDYVENTTFGARHKHCNRCGTGYSMEATECTEICNGRLTADYLETEVNVYCSYNGLYDCTMTTPHLHCTNVCAEITSDMSLIGTVHGIGDGTHYNYYTDIPYFWCAGIWGSWMNSYTTYTCTLPRMQ